MKLNIDLNKAVGDFCKEYGLCPTKDERILLKLAFNKGIYLMKSEEIRCLKKKLRRLKQ